MTGCNSCQSNCVTTLAQLERCLGNRSGNTGVGGSNSAPSCGPGFSLVTDSNGNPQCVPTTSLSSNLGGCQTPGFSPIGGVGTGTVCSPSVAGQFLPNGASVCPNGGRPVAISIAGRNGLFLACTPFQNKCPAGTTAANVNGVFGCVPNQFLNSFGNSQCPTTCPAGFVLNTAGQCVPANNACPPGFVLNAATGQCVPANNSCPPGFVLNSMGQCVPNTQCPPGFIFDIRTQQCVPNSSCPQGQHRDPMTGMCVPDNTCPPCQTFNPSTGQCVPCSNFGLSCNADGTCSCAPGTTAYNGFCVPTTPNNLACINANVPIPPGTSCGPNQVLTCMTDAMGNRTWMCS